jgi:3',5'-nucleoside bisphosphate phosphatase
MPKGVPFTRLCQLASIGPHVGRADLHLHTTHSDGAYTPAQIIDLARRGGLSAVAITDHDTLAAIALARALAAGTGVEIVPGVEISTSHQDRELHLLAYFVEITDPSLNEALAWVCRQRVERFQMMVQRLGASGIVVPWQAGKDPAGPDALGRRYLAELLLRAGQVGSIREAFARYLGDGNRFVAPKQRLPVARAIQIVRDAGGIAAWAHPGTLCDLRSLVELRELGLGAVEVDYPEVRRTRQKQLRDWAAQLGLAVTGGSDCHGPGRREVGCCGVSAAELEQLRSLGRQRSSLPC